MSEEEKELVEMNRPEILTGIANGKYPGCFPKSVEDTIRKTISSPSLHLFSGSSRVGDVRLNTKYKQARISAGWIGKDFKTPPVEEGEVKP